MNKKLIIAAMCVTLTGSAVAQELNFKGKTLEERIGYTNNNNEDSIKVGRSNVSLFQQSLANKDWAGAYENFSWLFKHAPYAVNGIYTQGPVMFYYLIQGEQDKAKKLKYFNELMALFEARQKNLDVINTFANSTSTLGDVLSVKADYYNWTAPGVEGSNYTLNKSYENYRNAITMINEKGGREIEGSVLQNFFLVSDAMYKSAPNALREQYLQDYLDSKDACERMLQLAKEAQEASTINNPNVDMLSELLDELYPLPGERVCRKDLEHILITNSMAYGEEAAEAADIWMRTPHPEWSANRQSCCADSPAH